MAHEILLESGTNELELLIFQLDKVRFGINVAKVREIIQRQEVVKMPQAAPEVEGTFKLRDRVLTLVNLGKYFGMIGEKVSAGEGLIIIVEFNHLTCGVLVEHVEMIHRLRWDQIDPPSDYLSTIQAPLTGVTRINEEVVLIPDFESAVGDILGENLEDVPVEESDKTLERSQARLLFADDSPTIRSTISKLLKQAGFESLTECHDGQHAWEMLEASKADPAKKFDIVLSDIEMPRMDGLHLTARIRDDEQLKDLPVVLFSSLLSGDNRRKGEQVGATAMVTKPDSKEMIHSLVDCLVKVGVLANQK